MLFRSIGSSFADIGSNIISGIWDGISSGWDWLQDKVSDLADSLLGAAKKALKINSPSKVFRDEVGVFVAQGIGVGFTDEMKKVNRQIEDAIPQEFDINTKANAGRAVSYAPEGREAAEKLKTKNGMGAGAVIVNQYIYANATDYAKQQREAARQFKQAARTVAI